MQSFPPQVTDDFDRDYLMDFFLADSVKFYHPCPVRTGRWNAVPDGIPILLPRPEHTSRDQSLNHKPDTSSQHQQPKSGLSRWMSLFVK